MIQSTPPDPWSRLVAKARRAEESPDGTAPYGFATRVAALAMALDRSRVSLMDRLAWRALGVACFAALLSVAANYQMFTGRAGVGPGLGAEEFDPFGHDDAVAIVLDLGD